MQTRQQHGYHHLETEDECRKRLKDEGILGHMRIRGDNETFDQWLEAHNQTRKMTYNP